ncbi:ELKS/Rab6-interacting/CAST family protein [Vibrio owensii]|uniref:ELKS/Rab6-interacting/CAST family protein n=1 Tax=Vibrio owensii TaxID=696485 RepID=UPI00221E799D|nr:ELKS/Rab6-interacting/CAST family protein [Vibrio owensii]
MLDDVVTSVKAYLYERAVSPLLGSLVISWCAWNYKFLLLLVSGLKYQEKLRLINVLYSSDYEIYFQGLLFPFLTSMAYLFLFPYPSKWVYKFSLSRQKVLNDLKNEIQENELLTLEQSKAIRYQLAEAERQFEELSERKDRAIESRDKDLHQLREELSAIRYEKDSALSDLNAFKETLKNNPMMSEKALDNVVGLEEVHGNARAYFDSSVEDEKYESVADTSTDSGEQQNDGLDFTFYYSAEDTVKRRYKRILEGLYLENRHKGAFGLNSSAFDSAMVQLVINGLVNPADPKGVFSITDKGRNFYLEISS